MDKYGFKEHFAEQEKLSEKKRRKLFMATEANTVTLSVASYNQTKSDNYRLNMFLDSVLNEAMITEDHEHLVFSTSKVEAALKFCFLDRYKRKLCTLKTQHTRYGTNAAPAMSKSKENPYVRDYEGKNRQP